MYTTVGISKMNHRDNLGNSAVKLQWLTSMNIKINVDIECLNGINNVKGNNLNLPFFTNSI